MVFVLLGFKAFLNKGDPAGELKCCSLKKVNITLLPRKQYFSAKFRDVNVYFLCISLFILKVRSHDRIIKIKVKKSQERQLN